MVQPSRPEDQLSAKKKARKVRPDPAVVLLPPDISFEGGEGPEDCPVLALDSSATIFCCYVIYTKANIEIKKVAEEDVLLPCHHHLGSHGKDGLDIEWLLQTSESNPKVVITYSAGEVYNNLNENQKDRVAFASGLLIEDASIRISNLQPKDAGQYSCKVKYGGEYMWSYITLIVLVKPSKPKCWTEGELTEGNEVTLHCKSAEGTDPIEYRWNKIPDKDGKFNYPPTFSIIDFSRPDVIRLKNVSHESTGQYQCTASNDAGEENCLIHVTLQYAMNVGVITGAVFGVIIGVVLILTTVWLVIRRQEKKKYEEEETPNEIREDAEAPQTRLVKPSSSSTVSSSSHSGSSSTRSTVNSMTRTQQQRAGSQIPNVVPSTYDPVLHKHKVTEKREVTPSNNITGVTQVLIPSQSTSFQAV
ncbi:CXADR-like membrane protein [Protopterus annectens]|uniref:CXADR-like membrane protein n=1 Tax=Protopterus annectens TaxID=7888 RepID=UPI001CF972EF|nr:CXADR-like membrane protein [Protopterus annectens]